MSKELISLLLIKTKGLKDNVVKLAKEWNSDICIPCDVADDNEITEAFVELSKVWDGLRLHCACGRFCTS